jgi:hypothetical protein
MRHSAVLVKLSGIAMAAALVGCCSAALQATRTIDSGMFDLSIADTPSGTETFRLQPVGDGWKYKYEISTPRLGNGGVDISTGAASVDLQWVPIRAEFKSVTATGSTTSVVGGEPLTLRQSSSASKMGASITVKIRPQISLADDSVIQFTAFCAVPRGGVVKAFPSIKIAVTQTQAGPDSAMWLLDLEGKGQVTVLCSRGKLLTLTENTKRFSARRRGMEDEIAASMRALVPVATAK